MSDLSTDISLHSTIKKVTLQLQKLTGANVNAKDVVGLSPLDYAIRTGSVKIVELLLHLFSFKTPNI